jgi:hypothetical protein
MSSHKLTELGITNRFRLLTKTAWNVIKTEIGKQVTIEDFYWFNNDGNNSHNYQSTSNSFNTYFLTIAEKITQNITKDNNISLTRKELLCATYLNYIVILFLIQNSMIHQLRI